MYHRIERYVMQHLLWFGPKRPMQIFRRLKELSTLRTPGRAAFYRRWDAWEEEGYIVRLHGGTYDVSSKACIELDLRGQSVRADANIDAVEAGLEEVIGLTLARSWVTRSAPYLVVNSIGANVRKKFDFFALPVALGLLVELEPNRLIRRDDWVELSRLQ